MPLYDKYDSLGLSSDKQPIVIDIGTAYTKVGFSAETSPRAILPTQVVDPETKQCRRLDASARPSDLYEFLVDFVHHLCFKHLLVSPKDRKFIVVESLLCPTSFRETLAKVLFRHFEVFSVMFAPSHLVSLCCLGLDTALVLDVGHKESVLIPVYQGYPVLHAWQAEPLAGHAVQSSLSSLLKAALGNGGDASLAVVEDLPREVVEDIKVRACFVTRLDRAQQMEEGRDPAPPPDASYREGSVPGFVIPGSVRERAYEVLFQQDNDEVAVPTMVLDAIVKCPIDMRRPLAENILVIGGTSMALGFKARLQSELKHLVQTSKYASKLAVRTFKFHTPPAKENYVAWLGGALFGGTDILNLRSLTKEVYLKKSEVPDWTSLEYNCRDEKTM
ncbi:actin-related protein 10 [Bacillus rossius redtenbacheri]|uniref:actin-related protein 10 n=1 Tax=Bacillus rossius redtenbacheri TaxID=93214 RepID=UPI002FDE3B0B